MDDELIKRIARLEAEWRAAERAVVSPNKARQAYLRAERELKRAEHDLKEIERAWRITSRLRDDACERYETAMDHAGAEEVLALAQKRGLLIVEGVVDGAA